MLHDVHPKKNDDGNLQNSLNSCFLPERSVPRQRQVFGITALVEYRHYSSESVD